METGTGKTYVYTHLIYELHQKFKINKFVIAVPSLAIKAGTAQFLTDAYVKRHFKDQCGYGAEIECEVLEPPKKKKKGRQYFPAAVEDFVKGSCQVDNRIYVLLVNMQLLTGSKNSLLQRDDYDAGVEGFYRPFDAIKATRPFVIIDEPHRFSRDQKAYQAIEKELDPQCIIRFGATFPLRTEGFGKSKHSVKDYRHLLYDLNACQSFNQGLIKGVVKEHFEPEHQKDAKVKIVKIESKKSVRMQYLEAGKAKKSFTLPSVPTILRPLTPCTRRWAASASKTRKWASTLSRIRTATGSRLSLHAERTAGKNPASAGFLPAILSRGGF
jgi:type III restriction enzyme